MALVVKHLSANAGDAGETGWSLGRKDLLEKEMATHSSILAWEIPWTEEPGGLHSSWGHKKSDTAEWLTSHNHKVTDFVAALKLTFFKGCFPKTVSKRPFWRRFPTLFPFYWGKKIKLTEWDEYIHLCSAVSICLPWEWLCHQIMQAWRLGHQGNFCRVLRIVEIALFKSEDLWVERLVPGWLIGEENPFYSVVRVLGLRG